MDIGVLIMGTYQSRLYDESEACLDAILHSLTHSNNFMEYKLYLI
jgi:hypothetical protein